MTTTDGAALAEATRYLDRPGGRIAYDVAGSGPLVVCVPGMGDVRTSHRSLAAALVAAGHRVATMDLRGHGDSDTGFDAFDDVAAGGDVLALIATLGGPAVVIGSSMGAAAAVWAAATGPEAVSDLVLLGPFVRDVPVAWYLRLALRVGLRRPWGPALWGRYLASLHTDRRPEDLDDRIAAVRASFDRPGGWAAFLATTRSGHAPVEARLGEVTAPTLVVMGTADPDFGDPAAEARWVAERLHGEVLLVERAGHYPHVEHPEVVVPAVLDLLAERTADA